MDKTHNALTQTFRSLIAAYKQSVRADDAQTEQFFGGLLRTHRAEHERWAASQRSTADDFNLLEVLEVEYDEASHSKILAWLLDHRIERGTHAQGNLGFRLFLEEFARELGADVHPQVAVYFKEKSYWVFREVASNESRVDIEIAAEKKFIIHIENKILAVEGEDQTEREWRDLLERAKQLQIPKENRHALFLTLDGCQPKSKHFLPIGWNRVAKVLDKFADKAKPPDVKLFARHYAAAVRKLAVTEPETEEIDNAQTMA